MLCCYGPPTVWNPTHFCWVPYFAQQDICCSIVQSTGTPYLRIAPLEGCIYVFHCVHHFCLMWVGLIQVESTLLRRMSMKWPGVVNTTSWQVCFIIRIFTLNTLLVHISVPWTLCRCKMVWHYNILVPSVEVLLADFSGPLSLSAAVVWDDDKQPHYLIETHLNSMWNPSLHMSTLGAIATG